MLPPGFGGGGGGPTRFPDATGTGTLDDAMATGDPNMYAAVGLPGTMATASSQVIASPGQMLSPGEILAPPMPTPDQPAAQLPVDDEDDDKDCPAEAPGGTPVGPGPGSQVNRPSLRRKRTKETPTLT